MDGERVERLLKFVMLLGASTAITILVLKQPEIPRTAENLLFLFIGSVLTYIPLTMGRTKEKDE